MHRMGALKVTNDTNPNKSGRTDAKTAVIHLTDGRTIEAPDYRKNDGWCLVLYEDRPGIDKSIPREAILVIDRIDDREDNDEDEGDDVKVGDVVTVRDEDRAADPGPWKVETIMDGEARLWSATEAMRHEPVEDLTVVEKAEDVTPPHSVPERDGGDA